MKAKFIGFRLVTAVFILATATSAFCGWENDLRTALQKGKEQVQSTTGGLAYTPDEATVLNDALDKALNEEKAPPCQCMKIAIEEKYNPFQVLTSIYGLGEEVKLDDLCMCATEEGILKEVIAKAAVDATGPNGEKVYERDEITQSQCLAAGLPYTAAETPLPDPPEPPNPIPPASVSTP